MATVHSSSSTMLSWSPSATIGSMQIVVPSTTLRALAGDPVVGHLRVHVHRGADAVADVVLDDAVLPAAAPPLVGEAVLDGRAHGIQALAHPQGGDAGPQRGLGVLDELEVLRPGGLGPADDDADRGVAVPEAHLGAAVDREQVALHAARATPGCRARSPR